MRYALKRVLATRGAVFYVPNVEFEDKAKDKYCVLMEDCADAAETLVVVFTTHRTEYAYQQTSVLVEDKTLNGIRGDTLIQCENWRELPADKILLNDRARFVGHLPPHVMARVDDALTYVRKIDEATLIRMQPQQDN